MPEMDGIERRAKICAQEGDVARVIMLTTFDIDEYVFDAPRAGASGFVLKDVDRHGLIEAIRVVADGNALLAPSVTRRLIDDFARRPNRAPLDTVLDQLTARERETVLLVAQGLTNAEIAAELVVSEATVKTHVGHILTKLSARDRVQIVIAAYELGLSREANEQRVATGQAVSMSRYEIRVAQAGDDRRRWRSVSQVVAVQRR